MHMKKVIKGTFQLYVIKLCPKPLTFDLQKLMYFIVIEVADFESDIGLQFARHDGELEGYRPY